MTAEIDTPLSAGDTGEFILPGMDLNPGDTGEFILPLDQPVEDAQAEPTEQAEPAEQAGQPAEPGQPDEDLGDSGEVVGDDRSEQFASQAGQPEAPVADEEERTVDAEAAMAALATDEGARSVDDPEIEDEPKPIEMDEPASEVPLEQPAAETAEQEGASSAVDPDSTAEIDPIELTALVANDASPSETVPFDAIKVDPKPAKPAPDRISGTAKGTNTLAWGSRSDVGCVRDHNEDSFVVRFPLFAVADGMGGHEAGEVASSIAVSSLAANAPALPDDVALGEAIEKANLSVIEGSKNGLGRPGMGTTCTAISIDGTSMSVGHVGDSRCYLLHNGQLVRVTHDHSYVEELVAAGEITPEEARVHPNRSIITRALGNDPKMAADHFAIEIAQGDRILLCSDGLSSMITDDAIEDVLVSTPTPQSSADALVEAALAAGGHDNVTCIVVDVKNDGTIDRFVKKRLRNLFAGIASLMVILLIGYGVLNVVASNTWYLIDSNGYVVLHRGIAGMPDILGLDTLCETTTIETAKLTNGRHLAEGIVFSSEEEARAALDSYQAQIDELDSAAEAAKAKKGA